MKQKAANCKMFKYHVYSFSKPNKVVLIKTDFQKKNIKLYSVWYSLAVS